ncbi:hypothetical protein CDAR_110511 [Caerostris darwini]|uniref:Uncharacterized protein n=1 Tax=Caerostris darwini TaxID=1538125 RepID=A0AAV4M619_9ARAC|nr:hypothetical protein CDAR_110511 [Caerostris darwini]
MEPPQDPAATQQLKFSRYHRTEGDVIIQTDEAAELDRPYAGPEPSWGPVYNQQGDYIRVQRQRDDRWDTHPDYPPQRIQAVDEHRSRFPPEPIQSQVPMHGYVNQTRVQPGSMRDMDPQTVYREQYNEQDAPQRQYVPHPPHHPSERMPLQRTLPPQPTFEPQRIQPEQIPQQTEWSRQTNIQPDHQQPDWTRQTNVQQDHPHTSNRQTDPEDDDARTVIMAPSKSILNQYNQNENQVSQDEHYQQQNDQFTSSYENHQEQQQNTVTFQDEQDRYEETTEQQNEPAEPDNNQQQDEEIAHPTEDHYQRKQSIRPSTQRLSTDDSGALSSRDKLGLEDTDVMDSRETHEESDRLGYRATEDEVSRTEDQNPPTDGEDEDSDSGIGKDGTALRLKKSNLMEKKSLFTIAYDGMQTRGLKSAGERDDSP